MTTSHRLIAFTTPENYAARLTPLIHHKGWTPLWCPTVTVEPTTHTKSSLLHYISPPNPQSTTRAGHHVDAYETRWMGVECAKAMVPRDNGGVVDAVVFTSTGEVEGMLKSLRAMGVDWGAVVERNPGVVVAAHGPVTAAGAERLGVRVDVVSRKFGSFEGVVDALDEFWND